MRILSPVIAVTAALMLGAVVTAIGARLFEPYARSVAEVKGYPETILWGHVRQSPSPQPSPAPQSSPSPSPPVQRLGVLEIDSAELADGDLDGGKAALAAALASVSGGRDAHIVRVEEIVRRTRQPLDVTFIVDITSSMSSAIEGVWESIEGFSEHLNRAGFDLRVSAVCFSDRIESSLPLTDDVAAFRDFLAAQPVYGGGDMPENPLDAVAAALAMPTRTGARRIMVVVTDAPTHQADEVTMHTASSLADQVEREHVTVFTISPPDDLRRLAKGRGGTAFDFPPGGRLDLSAISPLVEGIYRSFRVTVAASVTHAEHDVRLSSSSWSTTRTKVHFK